MPRAQTVPTPARLSAARRAVPGGPWAPTPRRDLTATRDFVSRHRSARRGRARLRALFRAVRPHHVPVAVSSTARHALPDPSYHPVRAADSQHTLDCKTLVAEQRHRTARVCRAARPLRAVTITQITYYSAEAECILGTSWKFRGTFSEPSLRTEIFVCPLRARARRRMALHVTHVALEGQIRRACHS